jgi:hypothetical protein
LFIENKFKPSPLPNIKFRNNGRIQESGISEGDHLDEYGSTADFLDGPLDQTASMLRTIDDTPYSPRETIKMKK